MLFIYRRLLSKDVLDWMRDVTGIALTDKVDLTCSKYESTGRLLCASKTTQYVGIQVGCKTTQYVGIQVGWPFKSVTKPAKEKTDRLLK